jgi:hypothetical protein
MRVAGAADLALCTAPSLTLPRCAGEGTRHSAVSLSGFRPQAPPANLAASIENIGGDPSWTYVQPWRPRPERR